MIKDLWKSIIVPMTLLVLFFASLAVFKNELISTLIIILCIIITFSIKYYTKEWLLLVVGIILGIICEIGGDLIYKLQYWETSSFLGIPYWLPILWGFGFIIIYRIGSAIVKK